MTQTLMRCSNIENSTTPCLRGDIYSAGVMGFHHYITYNFYLTLGGGV